MHWSVAITKPVPDKTSSDPASEARVLMTLAAQVGIRDPLPAVERLLERERRWPAPDGGACRGGRARAELLASDELTMAAVDRLVAVLRETGPWLDHQLYGDHPRASPAMDPLGEVREGLNDNAQQTLYATGAGLYARFSQKAAEQVAAVERLAPLPPNAWANPNPASVVLGAGRDDDWMVILRANQRFQVCWNAGWMLRRESIGSEAVLPGDLPRLAFLFRDWEAASVGLHELRRLHEDVRLVRAAQLGWRPGLWSASDYREPARSGLLAKLRG